MLTALRIRWGAPARTGGSTAEVARPGGDKKSGVWTAAGSAAVTVFITLAALVYLFDLGKRDLSVPLRYGHDTMFSLTWIKAMLDDGWWAHSGRIGAPGKANLADFPQYPHLHFAAMKLLTPVTDDAVTLMNLYFLLGFPLTSLAALAAFRAAGLGYGPAVAAAVLYAFLPYHFWRGVSHLFLATYFMIPLLFLVIIWLGRGEEFLFVRRADGRHRLDFRSPRACWSILICAALGFDFPYYPAFAVLFLTATGVAAYFAGGGRIVLIRAGLLAGVVAASFAADMSPSLMYRLRHGANPSPLLTSRHQWQDAELFGLTLTQMVLPPAEHRVGALKAVRDKFYASTPIPSEGDAMALGAVGALGLLLVLACVVCCARAESPRGRLYHLFGLLVVFAILSCTVGGFATLFNLLGTGLARTYNRVSVFVAFPALAVVFGLLDDLIHLPSRPGLRVAAGVAVPAAVLGVGLYDQTGAVYVADPRAAKQECGSDARFVARIEAAVPDGTMVFQLPYLSFLSIVNSSHKMEPYDHFRGFVHSRHLRWSYGAPHARAWDAVHAEVARQPLPEAVRRMALLGFGGVYVDRAGYTDNGREVEAGLVGLTGSAPLVSDNGRLAFYDLSGYTERLRASSSPGTWERERDRLCRAPWLIWGEGFFTEETLGKTRWRWAGPHGEIWVVNSTDKRQAATLTFKYRTVNPGPASLTLGGPLVTEQLTPNPDWTVYSKTLWVPPGRHRITLDSDAAPYVQPVRTVVFAIADASIAVFDEATVR